MNYLKFILVIHFFISTINSQELATGKWNATLQLNDTTHLPFDLIVTNNTIIIKNGLEEIPLKEPIEKENGMIYHFKEFNSYLIVNEFTNDEMIGYWVNKDRKQKGIISFYAAHQTDHKEYKKEVSTAINGKWEVTFSPNNNSSYPAIGKFKQDDNNNISGTFLTETGDYRFLTGKQNSDGSYYLSCFDGSHVFLFEGKVIEDSISGIFYSGRHWNTNFTGIKNDNVSLSDPYSLTYLKENQVIEFNKKQLDGTSYQFPNKSTAGKVTIVQIIGSWCPNCLDETRFFKELYEDYNDLGLEIVAIGYEVPQDFKEQAERLQNYKETLGIPYTVLVGGTARKDKASEDFYMLNEISSFPTSILFNKAGEVVRILTGFNGPGTGIIYEEYVSETRRLIKELLEE